MLVDDGAVLLAENDVAVLSHDLHDQLFPAKEIPHLIQVFQLKFDDALQPGWLMSTIRRCRCVCAAAYRNWALSWDWACFSVR